MAEAVSQIVGKPLPSTEKYQQIFQRVENSIN